MELPRYWQRLAVAVVVCTCVGCGEETGIAGNAGPTTTFGPALFDCTSLGPDGTHLPQRASTVPVGCALDPACRTPQISGHRGVGGLLGRIAPEDTLAAYRAGIALGIEFVETDPRPTADGVIVNLHDTTVDRTTDGTGSVDQMTFAEIRALHIKAGSLAGDFSCERVPTLTELLQTCRGRVVVLVDANKTDRVDLLVQAIHDADAVEWAIFDTSSVDKIDRALAIDPQLHFQIRPSLSEIAAQLDHFAPRLPTNVELQAADVGNGAPIVHARGARVLSDVFAEDVAAGLRGDVSVYARAFDAGIDAPQTDRPELVLQYLRLRGLRRTDD
jgi:glycerophosphoryl diester phosphodiesterase